MRNPIFYCLFYFLSYIIQYKLISIQCSMFWIFLLVIFVCCNLWMRVWLGYKCHVRCVIIIIDHLQVGMSKSFSYLTILILVSLIAMDTNANDNPQNLNFVYTIPYLRTFRPDLLEKTLGCNLNIVYSSYTHPEGLRDAAHIMSTPYQYGGIRCQPRDMYLKVFGYAQNYAMLTDANGVADAIKRSTNGKFKNIVVDWKYDEGNLIESGNFLNSLVNLLESNGATVYVKLQASLLCKNLEGRSFLQIIPNAKKIIVQVYGEDPAAYKNKNQIFLSQMSESGTSFEYPQKQCPKFPSYMQLTKKYLGIDFYIEKTLQQEEHGYLGEHFYSILEQVKGFYDKKVFFDAYPENIIRL